MRPLRSVCIYLVLVFLGGGLAAPWLFQAVHWGATVFPGLETLARNPFHRYVHRSLMVLAVIGLWPLLRGVGIRSWADAGWAKQGAPGKELSQGLLLGFGSLAIVALLAIGLGSRSFQHDHTGKEILKHLLNAGLAALLVAPLEETLFRGALFGALRKALVWPIALVLSSAFYALVHFFERPDSVESVRWSSGLVVLATMLRGFGDVAKLVPGFFNLTLAGIILGLVYQIRKTLYFSIGLHAGWIFWLKSYAFLVQAPAEASNGFWGSSKLIDGWFALAVLSGVLLLVWRLGSTASPATRSSENGTTSPG